MLSQAILQPFSRPTKTTKARLAAKTLETDEENDDEERALGEGAADAEDLEDEEEMDCDGLDDDNDSVRTFGDGSDSDSDDGSDDGHDEEAAEEEADADDGDDVNFEADPDREASDAAFVARLARSSGKLTDDDMKFCRTSLSKVRTGSVTTRYLLLTRALASWSHEANLSQSRAFQGPSRPMCPQQSQASEGCPLCSDPLEQRGDDAGPCDAAAPSS